MNASGVLAESDVLDNTARVPLIVPTLACNQVVCGGACCPANKCEEGVCMLADLVVDADVLVSTQNVETTSFGAESCAMVEGCIEAPGDRRLLRFSTTTPNIGNADLYLGPPAGNDLFHFSDCHDHWHFDEYAEYRLLDAQGNIAATGHKQAFCLIDLERNDENAGPGKFDCENQGITKGWADTYYEHLDCQWIDVTGLPGGEYVLEVRVNPAQLLPELDYTNDVARVSSRSPTIPTPATPSTRSARTAATRTVTTRPTMAARPSPRTAPARARSSCRATACSRRRSRPTTRPTSPPRAAAKAARRSSG
jgi:hypothetical protein